MEHIILSSDGPLYVYAVPDEVAWHLEEYCKEFTESGIWKLIAANYDGVSYADGAVCFSEQSFVLYLNEYLFPNQKSWRVADLGYISHKKIPKKYRDCPRYNF